MDAIITLEEVTGFLKNPPSLAPRPDFNRLRALRQHIVRALKQLTCPQSAIHGWSGLAITPAMYLLIEPQPFAEPPDPGNTAIYPQFSPPSTMKMIDATFTETKITTCLSRISTEHASKCSTIPSPTNLKYRIPPISQGGIQR